MTESFKFYEVGGKIRDELLGLKSKDVDYVAVPTNELLYKDYTAEEMFKLLYADLAMEKFEIFLVPQSAILYVLNSQRGTSIKVQRTL